MLPYVDNTCCYVLYVMFVVQCAIIGVGECEDIKATKGDRGRVWCSTVVVAGWVTSPKICSSLRVLAMKRNSGLIHFWSSSRFLS